MFLRTLLAAALASCFLGCGGPYSEPTVKAFTGRVLREGQPVAFADAKEVTLSLFFHKNGEQFGIPIQPDGTFKIGWMPIGKYTGALEVRKSPAPGQATPPPIRHQLPDGFEIQEGKTEYDIELGKGFKT